jgi:long-chain acyl-CoA synthetase
MSDLGELKTLHDVLLQVNQEHPENEAFIYRAGTAELTVTYHKFYEDVLLLSNAFADKGIGKGDKVLFVSDNRYAWIVTDFALIAIGAINVPRGSDTPGQELEYIIDHSDCTSLVIETLPLFKKNEEMFTTKKFKNIFVIEGEEEHTLFSNLYCYNEMLEKRTISPADIKKFAARSEKLNPDDPFTLIYTSGTTGNPKGVILTHANIMYNVRTIPLAVKLKSDDRWLSVLPTWHIFERAAEYMAISSGGCTVYSSVKTFADDLKTYSPTMVCSVPRLWESLYSKINAALDEQGKAKIFALLVKVSATYRHSRRKLHNQLPRFKKHNLVLTLPAKLMALTKMALLALPYRLAQKKFEMVQARFGGKLRVAVSGGGSLPKYLDEWIDALGIRIVNAYGMTECAPAIAARGLNCEIFGTLGPPLVGTELRIADENDEPLPPGVEGEIQVRGPQVMPGYYNNDAENFKTFSHDDYLRTGDLGMLTFTGELIITGRAKEIIVLSSGENIDPTRIEGAITRLPFIKDAVLVGQDRKGLAALIVPDMDKLKEFAKEKLQPGRGTDSDMLKDVTIVNRVRQEINRLLHPKEGFKAHERLQNLSFLKEDFKPGEELTNTLKKKRYIIERRYKEIIDKLFH